MENQTCDTLRFGPTTEQNLGCPTAIWIVTATHPKFPHVIFEFPRLVECPPQKNDANIEENDPTQHNHRKRQTHEINVVCTVDVAGESLPCGLQLSAAEKHTCPVLLQITILHKKTDKLSNAPQFKRSLATKKCRRARNMGSVPIAKKTAIRHKRNLPMCDSMYTGTSPHQMTPWSGTLRNAWTPVLLKTSFPNSVKRCQKHSSGHPNPIDMPNWYSDRTHSPTELAQLFTTHVGFGILFHQATRNCGCNLWCQICFIHHRPCS